MWASASGAAARRGLPTLRPAALGAVWGDALGSAWRSLPAPAPLALTALGGVRGVIRHPVKTVGSILGHKLEVIYRDHTGTRGPPPPKIPKHPMQDLDQNMNELLTYSDLKIRWQWSTKFNANKMKIARRWKSQPNFRPAPKPTCAFIWHWQMPHRTPAPEMPPVGEFPKVDTSEGAFAVFKSSLRHQHKVTVGDIVQIEKLHRREAGERVVFGTVLLVGTRKFTIIGKPTVPYAKVKATIEQQTLTRDMISFRYKSKGRQSRFLRRRQFVTMLRIDEIVVDPAAETQDPPPPKPARLLDLWANRWLDPAETADIDMVEGPDGQLVPKTALIYDGSEHQPGTYHRRGLTSCYRFWPDPQHHHWGIL